MSKSMLIDAVHPEETRVALVTDGRVDDFDFEAAGKKQLRGNIYLAKITRVEPSLQAAFVEYGGNRHGFLAFNEIHPDYYQLPKEDREAILREEAERVAAEEASDDPEDADGDDEEDDGETADADSEDDARPRPRRASFSRRYKIQEVVRRNQILLVQVVKEERGNKGAALTTYLSLAGRYCVLMPNTPRGGGISRKISNATDRKRLRAIMTELDVPAGMGLIVRTAGAKRTKTEIKRDFEYLLKLWDNIRDLTLKSIAPCLVNEEGGLVHRAMRDLYDKDVEEVLVQGEPAYREAKDLAKLLMPSHARKVKLWKDPGPLFVENRIEDQLNSIFSPVVQLKSGGYLVINQTEALVAIDVNSGKSTRERNIEQTALRTNLEAAEEACRQMRLRDLAGLVVIDFIDMDESKNNRAVEKKLKECLKLDRARVQHGRISGFGLMEISRQRRRAGVLDASSDPCPACNGTGRRRSIPSAALQLLRGIEARAAGGGLKSLTANAPGDVAIYLFNNKRDAVTRIEEEAGLAISIRSSDDLLPGDFAIEAEKDPNAKPRARRKPLIEGDPDDGDLPVDEEETETTSQAGEAGEEDAGGRRRRRRGGRGRRRREEADTSTELEVIDAEETGDEETVDAETSEATDEDGEDAPKKRRRRGRRGGRRRRRSEGDEAIAAEADAATDAEAQDDAPAAAEETVAAEPAAPPPPLKAAASAPEDGGAYLDGLTLSADDMLDAAEATGASEPETPAEPEPEPEKRPEPALVESAPEPVAAEAESPPAEAAAEEPKRDRPKKRGWWQRRKAS
ncbi:MAG: ribonuclease E/G [Pseudomonadota bacterium]